MKKRTLKITNIEFNNGTGFTKIKGCVDAITFIHFTINMLQNMKPDDPFFDITQALIASAVSRMGTNFTMDDLKGDYIFSDKKITTENLQTLTELNKELLTDTEKNVIKDL